MDLLWKGPLEGFYWKYIFLEEKKLNFEGYWWCWFFILTKNTNKKKTYKKMSVKYHVFHQNLA